MAEVINCIRELHFEFNASHNDIWAKNILKREGKVILTDFDGVKVYRKLPDKESNKDWKDLSLMFKYNEIENREPRKLEGDDADKLLNTLEHMTDSTLICKLNIAKYQV